MRVVVAEQATVARRSFTRQLILLAASLLVGIAFGGWIRPSERGPVRELRKARTYSESVNQTSDHLAPHLAQPWEGQVLPADATARGLSYHGSGAALQRVVSEMVLGSKPQAVVFLGASVAFGRGAPTAAAAFPQRFRAWLESSLRPAGHTFHNAAIPGSTSGIFAACTEALVPQNASLIILEFAANDYSDLGLGSPERAAFELLLRKLLRLPQRPAIVMLHHWCYSMATRTSDNSPGAFDRPDTETDLTLLAQYYDVPALSLKAAVLPLMRANVTGFRNDKFGIARLNISQQQFFYTDPCHPSAVGHQALADLLIAVVQKAALQIEAQQQQEQEPRSREQPSQFLEEIVSANWTAKRSGLPPPMQPGVQDALPPALCLLQEAFEHAVAASHGFQWKADKPEAPTWPAQKWSWQSSKRGDWAELWLDTREGSVGLVTADAVDIEGSSSSDSSMADQAPALAPAPDQQQQQAKQQQQQQRKQKAKANQQNSTTVVTLSLLKSYQGMGVAKIACVSGCTCAESVFDGAWERRLSLSATHRLPVTQHAACRIRVTVAGQADGKVALKSLAISSVPLVLGNQAAVEGPNDGAER